MDADPVLFRFYLYLAGGRACSGNPSRDVVGGRDQAKCSRTKATTGKFKLRHNRFAETTTAMKRARWSRPQPLKVIATVRRIANAGWRACAA